MTKVDRNSSAIFRVDLRHINSHVNINITALLVPSRPHIKGPEDARYIDGHRRRAKMHTGTDTAAPAKSAVAKCARVVPLLEESLRPELMGLREVGLVQMDCKWLATTTNAPSLHRTECLLDHNGAIMVLPFGINIPLYTSSAVLAWGVPPSTATGLHLSVSDTTALMYVSLGRSSKLGRRSGPTIRSSSSCARGMKVCPNLTHARMKLARDPADCFRQLTTSPSHK